MMGVMGLKMKEERGQGFGWSLVEGTIGRNLVQGRPSKGTSETDIGIWDEVSCIENTDLVGWMLRSTKFCCLK